MNTRLQPNGAGAWLWRRGLRPLMGALLLLLLGWGSAAPAGAVGGTISGPFTEVTVYGGETLNIENGASSSGRYVTVSVQGGTVNIHGGSLSATGYAVSMQSGTVNITGGSLFGSSAAVALGNGCQANISGGTISGGGNSAAILAQGGTTNISGGTVNGNLYGVVVGTIANASATVNVSGGSFSPLGSAIRLLSGTANISGGTISSVFQYGVERLGGAVSIYGCGLQLSDSGQLTGTLQYGTPIDTLTRGLSADNLINLDSCGPPACVPGLPQVTCPSNLQGSADPGLCSASLDPGTASAADNCSSSLPVTWLRSDGAQSLSAPYPVGTTTITWTATNAAGPNSCTQTISVTDDERPTISAPAPVGWPAGPDQCAASGVILGTPTTHDNCAVASVTNDAPASFPVGSTTVTWTVLDIHGNRATATQTVTVQDKQQPTLACPNNMTVPASSASGAVVSFTVPASDNCAGVSVQTTPLSGSLFPVGTTTVNCTATDAAGNKASCSFTVIVQAPQADVAVSQTASPSPVVTGSQLTYQITVSNNGPLTAQGVVLTDPLPAGTTFVSATRSANIGTLTTPKGANNAVKWSLPPLDSGQSYTLTVVVKVSAKANTTVANTATVSSSSPTDPNSSNNASTAPVRVVAKR